MDLTIEEIEQIDKIFDKLVKQLNKDKQPLSELQKDTISDTLREVYFLR